MTTDCQGTDVSKFAEAQRYLEAGDPLKATYKLREIENPNSIEGYSAFRLLLDRAFDDCNFTEAQRHMETGFPEQALKSLQKVWNHSRFEGFEKLRQTATEAVPAKRQIERIGNGEYTVAESRDILRSALMYPGMYEHAYTALETVTWALMRMPSPSPQEIADWYNLVMSTRAYLALKGLEETAIKLETLGHLIHRSAKFDTAEEIMTNTFVPSMLRTFEEKGGSAQAIDIATRSKLDPTFVDAYLFKMAAAGLLERDLMGRQARFTLTKLAREKLAAMPDRSQT